MGKLLFSIGWAMVAVLALINPTIWNAFLISILTVAIITSAIASEYKYPEWDDYGV